MTNDESRPGRPSGRPAGRSSGRPSLWSVLPLDSGLLQTRPIEWPTVALFGASYTLWAAAVAAGLTGWVSPVTAVIAAAVAAYAVFTPMHEAGHRSLARSALLNGVIGRLSGVLLMAPFLAVRHFHVEHHKHTNEADQDPDHWSGRGPWWLLPLRWATQDLYYYYLFLRSYRAQKRGERIETVATMAVFLGLVALAFGLGYGEVVLLYWIAPARVAIFFLAFAFDYLPHYPHGVTAAQDRYRATRAVDSAIFNVLLFGQNYHLIHHLYPAVPFYRYRAVWKYQREELLKLGATGFASPQELLKLGAASLAAPRAPTLHAASAVQAAPELDPLA
ncbi:delta(12)-fatty acid dehydrogenase [Sorangium cellulosum]|uniref:Delta(12)-fatty acid dehydrogenase n=1 Tax=Sorangium cellulosum TaxID=56 RepID=A0A2L0F0Q2_SORCE|nr:fatty acid desaturase [Sorangium cellulosum]AUX45106.1 delta(12)-fatty acid dehydrogenase [Sorangium cellulosum]